ncbi:MAG: SDR family oxidoreductase [Pseudomonadales bacterium]|nr:SDR family oxidoreductase [Pseudomonadales bacterium]
MIDLSGKTALVTGGSRGIGRAVCTLLARAGADVVLSYRSNHEAAAETVRRIEASGAEALAVPGDLSQEESVDELFKQVEQRFDKLDIFVANSGIWARASIDTMTNSQWRETMAANLDATYFCCSRAARLMKAAGSGKIILVTSTAGQRGEADYSHYAASKGAMIAMTRSLGSELGPFGINVNSVAPGWVRTDMTEPVFSDENFEASVIESIPVRRIAEPEDIAGPVLFLASSLARHLQGSVLSVNGGSVMA